MKYILLIITCVVSIEAAIDIDYRLTTSKEPTKRYNFTYDDFGDLNFDPSQLYQVLCHGWTADIDTPWYSSMTEAFMTKQVYNVITVGYKQAVSDPLYIGAALNVPAIGQLVANMIVKLNQTKGIPLDNFHLIGHSLGGHVVGIAGENIINQTGLPIHRVTGLDPAFPGYYLPIIPYTPHNRISVGDAKFVDVIHTSFLGIPRNISDLDYYPNGGIEQPGCNKDIGCNHLMSIAFHILSITETFVAVKCKDYDTYQKKACGSNETVDMGEYVNTDFRGSYYLTTSPELVSVFPWLLPNSQTSKQINDVVARNMSVIDH